MEPRLAAVHYEHQDLVVYNETGKKCYQPETKVESALDIHEIREEEHVDADYVQCDFVEEMLGRGDVFVPGFLSQGVAKHHQSGEKQNPYAIQANRGEPNDGDRIDDPSDSEHERMHNGDVTWVVQL